VNLAINEVAKMKYEVRKKGAMPYNRSELY
jgi:hypothetical protein